MFIIIFEHIRTYSDQLNNLIAMYKIPTEKFDTGVNVLAVIIYLIMTGTVLVIGFIINNAVIQGVGYFFIALGAVISLILGSFLLYTAWDKQKKLDTESNNSDSSADTNTV